MLVTGGEREALIDRILTTTAAIAEEVRDTTVFVLPGGVHEVCIEVSGSGEMGERMTTKTMVIIVRLQTTGTL